MQHQPATHWNNDNSIHFKRTIGLLFFLVYALVYAGFIIINTLAPKLMATQILFELNLAVVYGYGLIFLAIIAGLMYNLLCVRKEQKLNNQEDEE